jgi:hypothetical protein
MNGETGVVILVLFLFTIALPEVVGITAALVVKGYQEEMQVTQ